MKTIAKKELYRILQKDITENGDRLLTEAQVLDLAGFQSGDTPAETKTPDPNDDLEVGPGPVDLGSDASQDIFTAKKTKILDPNRPKKNYNRTQEVKDQEKKSK